MWFKKGNGVGIGAKSQFSWKSLIFYASRMKHFSHVYGTIVRSLFDFYHLGTQNELCDEVNENYRWEFLQQSEKSDNGWSHKAAVATFSARRPYLKRSTRIKWTRMLWRPLLPLRVYIPQQEWLQLDFPSVPPVTPGLGTPPVAKRRPSN